MDIRDWPIDRIMQLPDWCFGRRWPVVTSGVVAAGSTEQWLIRVALPDRCVIWGVRIWGIYASAAGQTIKFALGDHEPASDAAFAAFEPLFLVSPESGVGAGSFYIHTYQIPGFDCRLPVEAGGRRIAIQFVNAHATAVCYFSVVFTVSSIPTEVPDWLISA